MSNLDMLKNWYNKVWIEGDLDSVDEFFTPDAEAQGMMDFMVGPEDFKALVAAMLEQIEDIEITFNRVVETGNWVWVQMSAKAKGKLTAADVEVAGQVMCRFANGKIVESYNQLDFLTLFEKLGLLPENTMALCLAGETIG